MHKKTPIHWGLWLYCILLTLVMGAVLAKSNFIELIQKNMGLYKPPAVTNFQHEMAGHLRRRDDNTPAGAILFIGDSITQGMSIADLPQPAENFGIGGDTSEFLAQRTKRMQSLDAASHVFLLVGINDLMRQVTGTARHIEEVIKRIPPSVPIHLISVLPTAEETDINNQAIKQLNKDSFSVCARYQHCKPLDIASHFRKRGKVDTSLYEPDGIHLNAQGYAVLKQAVMERLNADQ